MGGFPSPAPQAFRQLANASPPRASPLSAGRNLLASRSQSTLVVSFVGSWPARINLLVVFCTSLTCLLPSGIGAEVSEVRGAVVRLEVITTTPDNGRLRKQRASGSGVIVSDEGYVISNYHVVRQAVRVTASLSDGRERRGEIVGVDPATDLAVLRLIPREADERFPSAQYGDSTTLRIGDPVWAVGSPGNISQATTAGVVANPRLTLPDQSSLPLIDGERVGRLVRWLAHDARIFGGNSGGPLIDQSGRIVGINEISVAGLGGAIPVELAREVATELMARGHVRRAWIGVEWQVLTGDDQQAPSGVRVGTVWPDSPAAQAGLQPGDVVEQLGIQPVSANSPDALIEVERTEERLVIGGPVPVSVRRGGAVLNLAITPSVRPSAREAPVVLSELDAVARDLTPFFAWDRQVLASQGVWIENVRPGGRLAQAKPAVRGGDLILALDGQPIASVTDLRAALERHATAGSANVVMTFERARAQWVTLMEFGSRDDRLSQAALRGWLGVAVQVAERPLAEKLGVLDRAILRITDVFPESTAAAAGLQVGDCVLAVDNERLQIRRDEDAGLLAASVRAYRPGTVITLTIWRDGQEVRVPVEAEPQPLSAADMTLIEIPEAECAFRVATAEDRRESRISGDAVIVARVEPAGWADLAGLRVGDVVLALDGTSLATPADVAAARERLNRQRPGDPVDLVIQRGPWRTLFLNLEWNSSP